MVRGASGQAQLFASMFGVESLKEPFNRNAALYLQEHMKDFILDPEKQENALQRINKLLEQSKVSARSNIHRYAFSHRAHPSARRKGIIYTYLFRSCDHLHAHLYYVYYLSYKCQPLSIIISLTAINYFTLLQNEQVIPTDSSTELFGTGPRFATRPSFCNTTVV